MPDNNLIKLKKETYLKMLENSVGTRLFNSLIVKNQKTQEVYDIFVDGTYSGATFVSGILSLLGMLDHIHATVSTLKEKLVENGFMRVGEGDYEPGDILIYEVMTFDDGTSSDQAAFYIGKGMAISTSYRKRAVIKHSYLFESENEGPERKILEAFRPNYGNNQITFGEKRSNNGAD